MLLALVALAGCGSLPRPFAGNSGATARRLAEPPPARLAVVVPTNALLSDIASDTLAGALADALVAQEVPAVAEIPHAGDWRLVPHAELRDGQVIPSFEVEQPDGKSAGVSQGLPVPAAAWADGKPAMLHDVAANAAPSVATLLAHIDAARRQSDPNSLYNRPARVLVREVTGAPGDGNHALTLQMRRLLPELGVVVQDNADKSDFIVSGAVNMAEGAAGAQRVEVQWTVADAKGAERGRILQLNEVPPGSLNGLWGDVATAVAREAAGGVHDVILTQAGRR